MAELETKAAKADADKFLQGITEPKKREDSNRILEIMKRATKAEPNLTSYMMGGFDSETLQKPGKYKTGKGCLYINNLEDVDTQALNELVAKSVKSLQKISKG